jgi:hypothetical protein
MEALARKGRNGQASQALNSMINYHRTSESPLPGVADGIEQHKVLEN